MVLIIVVIIIICSVIIIALLRAKSKLKAKLKRNDDTESKIYEEIDKISQQSNMNTADNVAYAFCGRRVSLSF